MISTLSTIAGPFAPQHDSDAAAKFILDAIFQDERLDELADLITPHSPLAGLEGEPAWLLMKRSEGHAADTTADDGWPEKSEFRAFVDPQGYVLAYPTCYMQRADFEQLLGRAVRTFSELHPDVALPAALEALKDRGAAT